MTEAPTPKETVLPLVSDAASTRDRVFVARQLPLFAGSGEENLVCGHCGRVIAENIRIESLYMNLGSYQRVIATCLCGRDNLLVTNRRMRPR